MSQLLIGKQVITKKELHRSLQVAPSILQALLVAPVSELCAVRRSRLVKLQGDGDCGLVDAPCLGTALSALITPSLGPEV